MPRKDADHLPLPAFAAPVPHAGVDPRAAGAGLRVAVLVQQVGRLLAGRTEAIDQLTGTIVVEPREVDSSPRQPLSRGADSQLHVAPLVGLLELQQGVVVVHADVVGVALHPGFRNVGALGSNPLELHPVAACRGVTERRTFNVVAEVEGRRPCAMLLWFQEPNSEPLRSFDVVLAIVDAVCGRENVAVPHQRTGATGGQFDRH